MRGASGMINRSNSPSKIHTYFSRLIGILTHDNNIYGFRTLNELTGSVQDMSVSDFLTKLTPDDYGRSGLSHGTINPALMRVKKGFMTNKANFDPLSALKLQDGASDKLPVIDVYSNLCVRNDGVIARARVVAGTDTVGALVVNYEGKCMYMSMDQLEGISSNTTFYNFHLKIMKGKKVLSANRGTIPSVSYSEAVVKGNMSVSSPWV